MLSIHSISKFDLLKCYDDTAEECIVWVFVRIKIPVIKEKVGEKKRIKDNLWHQQERYPSCTAISMS